MAQKHDSRSAVFMEAFSMLDVRGGGVLNIDSMYDFCEALPQPPAVNAVKRLFNTFDIDGSGDIDADEFLDFCQALERLTCMDTEDMLRHYRQAMRRRLFEMVDDSGDGLISKDELKQLIDCIAPILSLKVSSTDAASLMGKSQTDLDFDAFSEVLTRFTAGKNPSQVVAALEEARRRRRAVRHRAKTVFQSPVVASRIAKPPAAPVCVGCSSKDKEIQQLEEKLSQGTKQSDDLQKQVEQLHAEIAAMKEKEKYSAAPQLIVVQHTPKADDGVQGNPWERVHSLPRIAGSVKISEAALHFTGAARIIAQCDYFTQSKVSVADTDAAATVFNELAQKLALEEPLLKTAAQTLYSDVSLVMKSLREIVNEMKRDDPAIDNIKVTAHLDAIVDYRHVAARKRDNFFSVIDSVVADRTKCADIALAVAPYSTRGGLILQCCGDFERATQKLLDTASITSELVAERPCDIELISRKMCERQAKLHDDVDSCEQLCSLLEVTVGSEAMKTVLNELVASLVTLQRAVSTSAGARKDKAVQTITLVDIWTQRRSPMRAHDAEANELGFTATFRSKPARIRRERAAQLRNPLKHLDRLLTKYIFEEGVQVPPNFARVEATANQFFFGTKKIEVVPSENCATVGVGGGYLLFDEYCRKFCATENRRLWALEAQVQCPDAFIQTTRPGTPRASTPHLTPRSRR